MPRYQITPSYLSRISYCHVVSFACPHMPQSCLTPVASPYAHPLHHAVSKWCLHDLRYPSLPGCVFYLVHGCSGRLVETDTKGHPLARPSLILEKSQFFRLQPGPTCVERAVRRQCPGWWMDVVVLAEAAASAAAAAAAAATTTRRTTTR